MSKDIFKYFVGSDLAFACDFCEVGEYQAEVFGKEVATHAGGVEPAENSAQILLGMEE